jgi:DNA-binding phage protein
MIKTSKFDAAKYLNSPEAMTDYLAEALATGDPEFICDALDVVDRASSLQEDRPLSQPLQTASRDSQS